MNANATPDLRKLPPAGTSPAHQDASCPRSDIPFTPIEAAFLKLFARDDIFGVRTAREKLAHAARPV